MTKTQFVLQYPGIPAKEVVQKAKGAGFALTEGYVYTIRSSAKTRTAKGKPASGKASASAKKAKGGKSAAKASAPAAAPGGSSAELVLLAVAAQVGLTRSLDLLQGQQRIVQRVMN